MNTEHYKDRFNYWNHFAPMTACYLLYHYIEDNMLSLI